MANLHSCFLPLASSNTNCYSNRTLGSSEQIGLRFPCRAPLETVLLNELLPYDHDPWYHEYASLQHYRLWFYPHVVSMCWPFFRVGEALQTSRITYRYPCSTESAACITPSQVDLASSAAWPEDYLLSILHHLLVFDPPIVQRHVQIHGLLVPDLGIDANAHSEDRSSTGGVVDT